MLLAQKIIGYTMEVIAIAALIAIIVATVMAKKENEKGEKPPLIDIR